MEIKQNTANILELTDNIKEQTNKLCDTIKETIRASLPLGYVFESRSQYIHVYKSDVVLELVSLYHDDRVVISRFNGSNVNLGKCITPKDVYNLSVILQLIVSLDDSIILTPFKCFNGELING